MDDKIIQLRPNPAQYLIVDIVCARREHRDLLLLLQAKLNERKLAEARKEDGDVHRIGNLLLEMREVSARPHDRTHAFSLQLLSGLDNDHLKLGSSFEEQFDIEFDLLIEHRKIERGCIHHISGKFRILQIDRDHSDRMA